MLFDDASRRRGVFDEALTLSAGRFKAGALSGCRDAMEPCTRPVSAKVGTVELPVKRHVITHVMSIISEVLYRRNERLIHAAKIIYNITEWTTSLLFILTLQR